MDSQKLGALIPCENRQIMVCECCLEQRVVGLKENRVKRVSEN